MRICVHYRYNKHTTDNFVVSGESTFEAREKAYEYDERLHPHVDNSYRIYGFTVLNK